MSTIMIHGKNADVKIEEVTEGGKKYYITNIVLTNELGKHDYVTIFTEDNFLKNKKIKAEKVTR